MPRPRLESASWWPDLVSLKDELPLRELAGRFGVSVNGLSRALKRAGVERKVVRPSAAPGTPTTPAGARKADPRSAEAQDWWPKFLSLKDKRSLAELAVRFGVAEITLQRAMKRTGTERQSQRGLRGTRESRRASRRLSPVAHLLGKLPDGEVAQQAGVSRYAVAKYRRKNGIPSVREGGTLHAVEPRLRGPVEPPLERREAYVVRVRLEGDAEATRYVAVGRDLAEAAAHAQSAVRARYADSDRSWKIEGLEFVGPAI